jgi:hypothetical protein
LELQVTYGFLINSLAILFLHNIISVPLVRCWCHLSYQQEIGWFEQNYFQGVWFLHHATVKYIVLNLEISKKTSIKPNCQMTSTKLPTRSSSLIRTLIHLFSKVTCPFFTRTYHSGSIRKIYPSQKLSYP